MNDTKTVLLTANYQGKPLEIARGLLPEGFSLVTMRTASHDELVEAASCADYILASGNLKIDRDVIVSAKKLKMIQRLGVGLDSLDFEALSEKRVPVYVNQGVNADSVAEHTLMFILSSLRRLIPINENTKNGVWKKQEQGVTTRELRSMTVGLIGIGNIGKRVAALLRPFGCRIVYYDLFPLSADENACLGIGYLPLDELFSCADVVSLHCPLTDETREIICRRNLGKMKDDVIIVNTSRGGLINEDDLLYALNNGKVGYAALDVFQSEPLKNIELSGHKNVICTPHIAGNTYDSFSRMMRCAFESIRLFDEGRLSGIEDRRIPFYNDKMRDNNG